jgi:hypothetical protein
MDCWLRGETLKYHLLWHVSPLELLHAWDLLSQELRSDCEVASRLPCFKHHHKLGDRTHVDGPPPAIFDCLACRKERDGCCVGVVTHFK